MLMAIGVLLGLVAPTDQSRLALEISTSQREVLVGEPVKLTVRLKAKADVQGFPLDGQEELPVQFLRVLVDDGTQVRIYVEFPRQIVEQVLVAEKLRQDQSVRLERGEVGCVDRRQLCPAANSNCCNHAVSE